MFCIKYIYHKTFKNKKSEVFSLENSQDTYFILGMKFYYPHVRSSIMFIP